MDLEETKQYIMAIYPSVRTISFVDTLNCIWDTNHLILSNERAHCHHNRGIVCFTNEYAHMGINSLWVVKQNRPTTVLLHEIAHSIAYHDFEHGEDWQYMYKSLLRDWHYPILEHPTITD